MAQTLQSLLPLLLLLLLSLFLITMHTTTVGGGTGGFHLDLIHRFSPRSPFYPGHNLTKSELLRELIRLDRSRISSLKRSINTTTIRPPVLNRDGLYLVAVAIGTGEGMHYYLLHLDTGSALTWTQCVPCDPCFPQTAPIFDPILSPTFRPLPCNDPFCIPPTYRCEDEKCKYTLHYADGASVSGTAARDTFTFLSSDAGHSESVPGLAFGCAHSSNDLIAYDGDTAGILGMDARPESFMTQLMGQTGVGRFSYCLSPNAPDGVNFLRFGDDIVLNGEVRRTPFTISNGFYYLTILDIAINNKPVNIPEYAFARRDDGSGGSIIDSGTGFTRLTTLAYDLLESDLMDYFHQFGLVEVDGKEHGMELQLCYKLPSYFDSFPYLTIYLQGAELRVEWEQVFYVDRDDQFFCLVMLPDEGGMTTIGSYQQADTRFVYDISSSELLFVPEYCEQTH